MNPNKMLIVLTIILVSAAALTVTVRYSQDPSQFSQRELAPISDVGELAPAFKALDKVPVLRRSGQASELDLLKALAIVVGCTLLVNVRRGHRATMAMFALCVVSAVVIAHPILKEIASGVRSHPAQMQIEKQ